MGALKSVWGALPLFIRAIVVGMLIVYVGSTLAVVPLVGNLKFHPEIPWALPATVLLLLLYRGWLAGWGPPGSTREARRLNARAGPVSAAMWSAAFPVIVFGVIALLLLRLAAPFAAPVAPPSVKINLEAYPLPSVMGGLAAIAISSAVVEELGFRGYMQRALEARYGLVPALLVTGVMFWVAHLPDVTITHLPGQMLASVVFGLLAWFTRSLWPAMLAHALADLALQPAYLFRSPGFVWEALSARPVWEGRASDLGDRLQLVLQAMSPQALAAGDLFALLAWAFLVFAVLTAFAFARLARVSRQDAATF
jgi:membrane protease YdiL (CAAX protease family)